jgi:hypothetical protein
VNPAWPVAQKPQPIAQPAWLDTHTVARSGYSMSTVSMRAPPDSDHRNLIVSPRSLTDSVTAASASGSSVANRSRSARGRLVISSGRARRS